MTDGGYRTEFQRVTGWLATHGVDATEAEDCYIRDMMAADHDHEPNYKGPGVYRHYKGGKYHVLGLALKEDTAIKPDEGPRPGHIVADELCLVIYRPLTPGSLLEARVEDFWARELSDFNATVSVNFKATPRFTLMNSNPIPVLDLDLGNEAERLAYRAGFTDAVIALTSGALDD